MSFPAALVRGLKSHPCSLNRQRDDRRGSSESLQIGRPSEAGDLHPAPSASIHISILAELPRRTCQKIKVRHRPAGSSSVASSEQEDRRRGGRKTLQLCVSVCVWTQTDSDERGLVTTVLWSPASSSPQSSLQWGDTGALFFGRVATEQLNGC